MIFVAAAIVYLLSISIGLERFPIYFFTDESVHANLASDFIANGFTSSDGTFLPTYFGIDPSFNLNGVSVYIQILPTLIFGKSVFVTRLVSGLITLAGAVFIGLLLKQVFELRSYWLGILLLITSPAWFLHARTAFEYMEVASFFAATLYFYNRYRQGQDNYLYATIISAALMFYTHGLGQALTGLLGIGLFISDLRYHFRPEHRRTLFLAILLAALFALPYLRFIHAYPSAMADEVRMRNSYWLDQSQSFMQKLGQMMGQYALGLNPKFWFFPSDVDLVRHRMSGYGNILWFMLPFALLGLVRALWNIRQTAYRSVLVALLVSPIPATIVAIGTPRVIWMVIPWAILIALGIDWSMGWLLHRFQEMDFEKLNLGLFLALSFLAFFILRDALVNGPTWFTDYSLYGMQYGATQLFRDEVLPDLNKDPNLNFFISPTWANGTDQLAEFFLTPQQLRRAQFGTPEDVVEYRDRLTIDTLFVLTSDEFKNFSTDPRFTNLQVHKIIPYPDGNPGFYIISLQFSPQIDQIMAAEHLRNRTPVEDVATINGETVRVVHSPFGTGSVQNVFDDDSNTLVRVLEANPFLFDLYPSPPLPTHTIVIQTGSLQDFTITIDLYAAGAAQPIEYVQNFQGLPPDPVVTFNIDKGPDSASRITISIKDNLSGDMSQIHVRTIQFK